MVRIPDENSVVEYLRQHEELGEAIEALEIFNQKIGEVDYNVTNADDDDPAFHYGLPHNIAIDEKRMFRYISGNMIYTYQYSENPLMSVNNLLFVPDLKKFSQIKHLTYGQYIHQQLEMFNYVMPTENSDA